MMFPDGRRSWQSGARYGVLVWFPYGRLVMAEGEREMGERESAPEPGLEAGSGPEPGLGGGVKIIDLARVGPEEVWKLLASRGGHADDCGDPCHCRDVIEEAMEDDPGLLPMPDIVWKKVGSSIFLLVDRSQGSEPIGTLRSNGDRWVPEWTDGRKDDRTWETAIVGTEAMACDVRRCWEWGCERTVEPFARFCKEHCGDHGECEHLTLVFPAGVNVRRQLIIALKGAAHAALQMALEFPPHDVVPETPRYSWWAVGNVFAAEGRRRMEIFEEDERRAALEERLSR